MKNLGQVVLLAGVAALMAPAAHAQASSRAAVPPGAVVQPLPAAAAVSRLNQNLSRLSRNPQDVNALIGAGQAALDLGDVQAANGFFTRANMVDPRQGKAKLGLAIVSLALKQPREAAAYFDEADALGEKALEHLSERGLAYDLTGQPAKAHADYRAALARKPGDRETQMRYAVSLGIAGDVAGAEKQLEAALAAGDREAWRNRAFILAMNGRVADARGITQSTMPKGLADALDPYIQRIALLTPAQRAAAVHFGAFPAEILQRPAPAATPSVELASRTDSRRTRNRRAGEGASQAPLAAASAPPPAPAAVAATKPPSPAPARPAGPTVVASPAPASASSSPSAATAAGTIASAALATASPPARATGGTRTPAASAPVTVVPSAPVRVASAPPPATPAAPVASAPASAAASVQGPADPGRGSGQGAGQAPASAPVAPSAFLATPAATPAAPQLVRTLADIIADVEVTEGTARPRVAPVDLAAVARLQDERRKAEARAAAEQAKKDALAKARAEAAAKAKAEAEEKARLARNPARIWVQIATGRDVDALAFDLRRLRKSYGDAMGEMGGWSAPWGATRRLLVGPYGSLAKAKAAVAGIKQSGGDAFVFQSEAGEEVAKLGGK